MELTNGSAMLNSCSKFVPILLRCFASIIHHSAGLITMKNTFRGHVFNKLAILDNHDLLRELQNLVTTDPTPGVIETPTGIPPHVNHARLLKNVIDNLSLLQSKIDTQSTQIMDALREFLNN